MMIGKENSKQKSLRILYGLGITILSALLVLLCTWGYLENKWTANPSIWKMPLLGILGIIVVLDLLIFVLFDVINKNIRKIMAKEKEVEAKLISKSSYPYTTQKAMVTNSAGGRSNVDLSHTFSGIKYEVLFQLRDGKMLTFIVSKQFYDTLQEGTEGKLHYKGKNLIGFLNGNISVQNGEEKKGFVSFSDDFK